MISYKHMAKLVSIIMAAAVVFCLWMTAFSRQAVEALGGMSVPMAYEEALFDTEEMMRIDIQMKQEEWEEMLENAAAKEYYACDVQINDQKLGNVGLRTKGNTSLSAIAGNPDTDRFSFKLEFDHYVEGQTCLGLDKLILNNNYADATSMKEAVVYDMYRYLGVDASLYNYAELSLNGEYLGVYLALEAVEDSFLLRNYGTGDGKLYKPDSMKMGGGEKGEFGGQPPRPGEKDADAWKEERRDQGGENFDLEEGDERQKTARGKMPGGSPSMGGGNGANLNYTDEELSSYSDIWDGEVTDTDKADHSRVQLSKILAVEQTLKNIWMWTIC